MKLVLTILFLIMSAGYALADMKYHPIRFEISTDKVAYYEGEKITVLIKITNTDKEKAYPVLIPHTQNTGQKLFYLTIFDKANNTMLRRYTEDKMINMMVHDTGTVQIRYLKPLEQIVIPIYLNDFENYYNYHTQNSSHHSFGVPLFAGVYKLNLTYNPYGIALGDSIYNYYNEFDKQDLPNNNKLAMSESGDLSNMIFLRIKRSGDTVVSIERIKYYIQIKGDRYFYFSEPMDEIISDNRLFHVTNLPPDSSSVVGEYFYSQFPNLWNEYIARFEDADIKEYRKYINNCPEYLHTEKYNDFKQKIYYACQLNDHRFYSISYTQPGDVVQQETYCSQDGTLCSVTTYIYNKKGELKRKDVSQTELCSVVEIDGKKKSVHKIIKTE